MYLTGNLDECVRNETDDTFGCVSLMSVIPGIWASLYALLLLSFNGTGGILYGGQFSVFNVDDGDDFNDIFDSATVKYDDWLCTRLSTPIADWFDSTPAEIKTELYD